MAASSARNVVLLTLIEMLPHAIEKSELDEKLKSIWNIFYHIYIPETNLGLLQEHAKRLWDAPESVTT